MHAAVVFRSLKVNQAENRVKNRDSSTHRKLLLLQKRIFKSLRAEADRLLGQMPEAIKKYEREYRSDFSRIRKNQSVTKASLIKTIRSADVTFIGDFHTFTQAQRTALRIIRAAQQPGENWFIGLELIPSRFQKALDDYQAGALTLQKFHQIIHYREEWGFPWENYAPIFDWARANGVRLIALNRPKELLSPKNSRDHSDLIKRDQWAAGVITDLFASERIAKRKAKMVVLYGELHIGKRHLPRQLSKISPALLKKPLRSVLIHQNVDHLFWGLAHKGREVHTEIMKLARDTYCVFSGTPWAKLQSLVIWAEGGPPRGSDARWDSGGVESDEYEDEDGPDEHAMDYLSLMRTYGDVIAEFLGVHPPSYEALHALTINDADFVDSLSGDPHFTADEFRLIQQHVLSNQRMYIPRSEIAYLATPSQNAAAELAAVHLLRSHTRSKAILASLGLRSPSHPKDGENVVDDYYRVVLEAAFGFLGSLIMNPRRKCDLAADHQRRVQALAAGSEKKSYPLEKEARELAVAVLRGRAADAKITVFLESARLRAAAMFSAHYVGQVLGKRLHKGLLDEQITIELIRSLFFARVGVQLTFEERYMELLKALQGAAVAPSKTETL